MMLRHPVRVARLITVTLGTALLLASAAPKGQAQSQVPRFERGDCLVNGDWAREVRRECGWLVVPESRDRVSGKTLRLAVEIFRAGEPNGAPPLVVLHGGPGGPGGIRLYSAGVAMSPMAKHRDVVIYDQRGAGFSEPKLCPAYERAADSASNLREGAGKERNFTEARRACVAELEAKGIDRLAYNTTASGADLIDLRHTLGYSTWDIRATSYGARLAQEVMIRDAQGIRAVLLESPVARSFMTRAEQPLSTQRAVERVFAACALQQSCHDAFPNLERDFYSAYDELTKSPLPAPITRADGRADTVWVDGSRLVADIRDRLGGIRMGFARIPLLVHELRAGDRSRAAREIVGDGSVSQIYTGRVVRELINCYDTYGPTYRKTLDSVNALTRAPFRRVDEDCNDWLSRFGDSSTRTRVSSDIPTLIVTGHFDDRTPTESARRIAATLSRVYLVEMPNEGHDARPTACHAAIVAQFFADPMRKPDTSCVATIPPIVFATTWEPSKY